IIVCDFLSAVSVIGVLAALLGGSWRMIFFTTLISAVLSQFSQPSGMKLFKLHVPEEQVQTGMALYQALGSIFMVLGPAVGTFVYKQLGIDFSIGIVGGVFLLSGLILLQLPPDPAVESKPNPDFWREFKEGFSYVYRTPILKYLGIAFALG